MRDKEISDLLAAGALVTFDPISPETKAKIDADLTQLLARLGIEEPLKPANPMGAACE